MITKKILLAASITAVLATLVPLTIIAQEGNVVTTTRHVTEDEFQISQDVIHELRGKQNKIENEALVFGESTKMARQIAELDAEIAKHMPVLDKYQEQKHAEYHIEPERRAHLESVERDLRQLVTNLAEENGVTSHAVNLDEKTQTIRVLFNKDFFKTDLENLTKQYANNISFDIVVGEITLVDTSCASRTSDCDPIVGGIKGVAGAGQGPCTIGLPVEDGWLNYGFITAGHCVDDNEKFYQPTGASEDYKIGDSTVSHYIGSCDCALVDKTTWTTSKSQIWRQAGTYLTVASESSARPASGTNLIQSGLTTGYKTGEVVDGNFVFTHNGITWDLIEVDMSNSGGDSGAPIASSTGSKIYGIVKGYVDIGPLIGPPERHYIATSWDEIDSQFTVDLH